MEELFSMYDRILFVTLLPSPRLQARIGMFATDPSTRNLLPWPAMRRICEDEVPNVKTGASAPVTVKFPTPSIPSRSIVVRAPACTEENTAVSSVPGTPPSQFPGVSHLPSEPNPVHLEVPPETDDAASTASIAIATASGDAARLARPRRPFPRFPGTTFSCFMEPSFYALHLRLTADMIPQFAVPRSTGKTSFCPAGKLPSECVFAYAARTGEIVRERLQGELAHHGFDGQRRVVGKERHGTDRTGIADRHPPAVLANDIRELFAVLVKMQDLAVRVDLHGERRLVMPPLTHMFPFLRRHFRLGAVVADDCGESGI